MRAALSKTRSNDRQAYTPRPGPFGGDSGQRRASDIGAALGTSLLVMYPVIAIVAVVVASLASTSYG